MNRDLFKRSIKKLRRFSQINDYWLLVCFGHVYYKPESDFFERDIIFVSIKQNQYQHPTFWNKERVVRIAIREDYTINFPLGTIFNWEGEVVRIPSKEEKTIYAKEVILSNNFNFQDKGLRDILRNTSFPIDILNKISDSTGFYKYYYPKKNKDTVIIPSIVIAKFFYYCTSSIISLILSNRFSDGIVSIERTQYGMTIVYNSDIIKQDDALILGRYALTNGAEKGYNILQKAISFFHETLINEEKKGKPLVADINFPLPFSFPLRATLVGQYIEKDTFMAYEITKTRPYNDKMKSFFSDEKILLLDQNDKRSSIERENKEIRPGTNIKGLNKRKLDNAIEETSPTINSLSELTVSTQSRNFFWDSPDVKKIDKDDQLYKYICEKLIVKEHSGYSLKHNIEANRDELKARKTRFSLDVEIEHFNVLFEALKEISSEKNYGIKFHTINDSTDEYFSTIKFRKKDEDIKVVIASINLFNKQFVIVDPGPNLKIGIFRNYNIPFNEKNDSKLTEILTFMLNKYFFRWSDFYYNEKEGNLLKKQKFEMLLEQKRIKVLQPFKHINKENLNIDLANRIRNRIVKDQ